MVRYIFERMKEPSTWRGVAALVSAAGIALTPEQTEAIVAAGLAVIGLIGAICPDKVR